MVSLTWSSAASTFTATSDRLFPLPGSIFSAASAVSTVDRRCSYVWLMPIPSDGDAHRFDIDRHSTVFRTSSVADDWSRCCRPRTANARHRKFPEAFREKGTPSSELTAWARKALNSHYITPRNGSPSITDRTGTPQPEQVEGSTGEDCAPRVAGDLCRPSTMIAWWRRLVRGIGTRTAGRATDAPGRPLNYGAPDVPRQPEGVRRSPDETIAQAQRLLDTGLPFQAHEVFEDAWKSSVESDRQLWKGLAQLAVGLTHLARGNRRGAQTLLQRGAKAIAPFAEQPPHGIEVAGVVRWADTLSAAMDAPNKPTIIPPMPVLRQSR